jgi:Skp family chaperone for outer membrane proteins
VADLPGGPAAGDGLTRRVAGAPVWVWVLGGTVVVAGGYLLLRSRKAATDSTDTSAGAPAYASPDAGALVPVSQGLGTQQAQDLQDAISQFAGPLSKAQTDLATSQQQLATTQQQLAASQQYGAAQHGQKLAQVRQQQLISQGLQRQVNALKAQLQKAAKKPAKKK